ncbi:MAG: galactose-1-phosphate uridylyltransferase [Acidobacteriota bacterium]|nr:galactose-1-phosphate uridylyltransferase [Acidobacteriota bacterium]
MTPDDGGSGDSGPGDRNPAGTPSEFRRDPINGRLVLIAPGRSKRPGGFLTRAEGIGREADDAASCPFCPGHENQTPPEIAALRPAGSRPDGPGWRVRVVPNKYPALTEIAAGDREEEPSPGRMAGSGAHEVVIDSPHHDREIDDLPDEDAALTWRVIRDRVGDLEASGGHAYIQVFKNRGREAGASLRHPHTQIAALPLRPPRLAEEMARFEAWASCRDGDCLLCRHLEDEAVSDVRLVHRNRGFTALTPVGSAFPYETRIAPNSHAGSFASLDDRSLVDLAACLRHVLGALKRIGDDPAYNIVLYQAPVDGRSNFPAALFHWHLDIFPLLVRTAGFEWGTGIHINPVAPEEAAAKLRAASRG